MGEHKAQKVPRLTHSLGNTAGVVYCNQISPFPGLFAITPRTPRSAWSLHPVAWRQDRVSRCLQDGSGFFFEAFSIFFL